MEVQDLTRKSGAMDLEAPTDSIFSRRMFVTYS